MSEQDFSEKIKIIGEVLDSLPFYAMLVDEDHRILFANNKVREEFKKDVGGILGEYCPKAIHGMDEPFPGCPLEEVLENECSPIEREVYDEEKNIWLISAVYPLNLKTEKKKRVFLHFARDITERKMIERIRKERMEHIEKEKRLSQEFNDILTLINKTIRHDVINNLTAIIGALEVYRETGDETWLEKISDKVKKCVEIIEGTKDLEVLYRGKEVQILNIREVIEEVAKDYDVDVRIDGNCYAFAGEAIFSVFDNLFGNAIKHGGASRIDVSIKTKNGTCEIRVADNGRGIPDEVRNRIFEGGISYGNAAGTGLGLYIVRKIVEIYGGSVDLESSSGSGAVFVIRLKCYEI
jgi:signal transduction histidine kinase